MTIPFSKEDCFAWSTKEAQTSIEASEQCHDVLPFKGIGQSTAGFIQQMEKLSFNCWQIN